MEKLKKSWPYIIIVAIASFVISADKVVDAGKRLWQNTVGTHPAAVVDKFTLSGVKMGFVVTELSEDKITVVGETIVPVFSNPNGYPVTIQFNQMSFNVNGVEAPAVPPDNMTITFPAGNGPAGWYGSDPRVPATNGTQLNGTINAKLSYFNVDKGLRKSMTIRGRVVAKLPKRGRVVSIEWWPDADSARASAQIMYKFVVLGPNTMPLSPEDQAVLRGETVAR